MPTRRLSASSTVWIFGGQLPRPVVALRNGAQLVRIRRATALDRERWKDPPGPPIRADLLSHIATGVEVKRRPRLYSAAAEDDLSAANLAAMVPLLSLAELDIRVTGAVDLLRLHAEGELQAGFQEMEVREELAFGSSTSESVVFLPFRSRFITAQWRLTPGRVADLQSAWRALTLGPNAASLTFPLRRLGIGAQRQFDEDRLLDYCIALEALFKRTREADAAVRVANRSSFHLLGLDAITLRGLRRELTRAFDLRNEVSHGGMGYDEVRMDNAIGSTEALLKDSLKALLGEAGPKVLTDSPPPGWAPPPLEA